MRAREKTYKVVCFDYYGTLVEVGKPFKRIREWICGQANGDISIFSQMMKMYAKLTMGEIYMRGDERLMKSFEYACSKCNADVSIDEFRRLIVSIFAEANSYSGANAMISELKKHFIVGIASNADNDIICASMRKNGFQFDFVVTSEDVKAEKPDRAFFLHLIEQLNVPCEEIIYIGDSWRDDVWGTNGVGIDCIWINRNAEVIKENAINLKAEVFTLRDIVKVLEEENYV